MKTPLWDALQEKVLLHDKSFHTPGHKSGLVVPQPLLDAWGADIWQYDLTEIPGLDNLAHPEGVLKASMAAWAAARGCAHVQYLLGGTSLGLKAAILGLCRGCKVFVPRHAHSSIYQGLALSGAEPIFLPVTLDADLGIPLGVAPEELRAAIQAHPDCKHLLAVHPTYHGITWRNSELFQIAREAGLTTIVDEAHGAHFVTDATPPSALALGADVVIESVHKTAPCLTQASIMLIGRADLVAPLARAVAMLHTTSPSYLLMASLEQAGAWLDDPANQAAMGDKKARIDALYQKMRVLYEEGQRALVFERREYWHQDPFKIYLTSPTASGEAIGDWLRAAGAEPEMTDGRGCLLMAGINGDDVEGVLPLVANESNLQDGQASIPQACYNPAAPIFDCAMGDAWFAPRASLPLDAAVGRTAAAILEPYPPGIPLMLPGEHISEEIVEIWRASGRDPKTLVEVLA
ncbi:MAG: aminotransferase class I/II-fold pyridoxal phosphate-dependent enzyme [Peptococcaceae bacterium]|nr:aminotransferase class I/II-fold pyridoxal phosphate-dependent enzyme [Peptococcaceae bacterium]